ncbi:MAG: hypothetical protein Q9203_001406 [Teloschistes exilis]
MSDSVDRVFAHAVNIVKRIPRTGSPRPSYADRFKLYGLYKQSMEGDVPTSFQRPPDDAPDTEEARADKAKWDAWHSNAGLSRTAAKRAYISTLIEAMHQYASTTPEGRDLVAELEFVWNQIKSNSNFTSSDSSPRGTGAEGQQGASYTNLVGSRAMTEDDGPGGGSPRLRVLRPLSEDDKEGYEDDGEEDEDEYVGFDRGPYTDPRLGPLSQGDGSRRLRDLDIRNRKWRKRIEMALFKMTTEVAALREQLEAKGIGSERRGSVVWAWSRWLVWISTRQLLVEVTLIGLAYLWARKSNDQKLQQGLWLVREAVKEQFKWIWGLKVWKARRSRCDNEQNTG